MRGRQAWVLYPASVAPEPSAHVWHLPGCLQPGVRGPVGPSAEGTQESRRCLHRLGLAHGGPACGPVPGPAGPFLATRQFPNLVAGFHCGRSPGEGVSSLGTACWTVRGSDPAVVVHQLPGAHTRPGPWSSRGCSWPAAPVTRMSLCPSLQQVGGRSQLYPLLHAGDGQTDGSARHPESGRSGPAPALAPPIGAAPYDL